MVPLVLTCMLLIVFSSVMLNSIHDSESPCLRPQSTVISLEYSQCTVHSTFGAGNFHIYAPSKLV